jgi:hypothetical protein
MTVAIHIRHRNRLGILAAGAVADRRLKRAVAVPQQHAYDTIRAIAAADTLVGHKQIGMAVAIHIRYRNRIGILAAGVVGWRFQKNRAGIRV